jgi:hypothetical protein
MPASRIKTGCASVSGVPPTAQPTRYPRVNHDLRLGRRNPAKADKRTRSKWSRVMRYAAAYKPDGEALDQFIRRKGGINACAARFSRRLGARWPKVREMVRLMALTATKGD